MEPRGSKWCVIATIHSESAVEVVVEADRQSVAKSHHPLNPLAALTATMAALAPFDESDGITVLVHGRAVPMSSWTGTNVYAALYWLATSLSKACCAYVPHQEPAAFRARPPVRRTPREQN
jgi:hypothetical protein